MKTINQISFPGYFSEFMSELVIHHHLGLGDCFICNGIVREAAKLYDKVFLFCKPGNAVTLNQMYSDIGVNLIQVEEDHEVANYTFECDVLEVGFNDLDQESPFDQQFYKLAGVNFEKRWSSFQCPRDKGIERHLAEHANPPGKFALVHDDERFSINESLICIPIVRIKPIPGVSLTHWLGIAEMATEIHVIDSSFLFLADSVDFLAERYIHRYARKFPEWEKPTLDKKWEIIL